MNKEEIKKLKENKDIKFIYKIPCSLYDEGFEYIIVGNILTETKENIRRFSLDDWFLRMNTGSLLPYVCSTLPRSGKIKEYLNIYDKPDLIKLRKLLIDSTMGMYMTLTDNEVIQESLWGIQIIKESKVNRPDVFKDKNILSKSFSMFLQAVDPIYKMSLNNERST